VLRPCIQALTWLVLAVAAQAETRMTGDLPRRAALGFEAGEQGGALVVQRVDAGSAAAAAGVAVGDQLLAVEGRPVGKPHLGEDLLRRLRGGARVALALRRGERRLELAFTPEPLGLEALDGVESVYGELRTPDGARLRSILTRPSGSGGRLPAIFLTQWVSCDSVEILDRSPFAEVLRGLATSSGAVMIRVERSSGGDSVGPGCHELDHDTELAHYAHAFEVLTRHPWVDPARVVIFGMSLGSASAPLLARGRPVAGVVVSGGGALTYYERMLGFERGLAKPEELDGLMRGSAELHAEYLLRGRSPDLIRADRPELAELWTRIRGTGEGVHYGRPYSWHQQLAARDLAAAWAALDAPALVVYGEYDQFEAPAAHQAIGRIVNRVRPGRARVLEVPRLGHDYRVYATPEDAVAWRGGHAAPGLVVAPILEWLRETALR